MLPLGRRSRAVFFAAVTLALACVEPPPDVASLDPLRVEDTRVVALLREADRDAERDPRAAARNIREIVLPRARANAAAAASVNPRHPRARSLASDLRSLLDERVVRTERYADALDSGDLERHIREVRAQREMETDMDRLDARIEAAAREPPSRRGCSR